MILGFDIIALRTYWCLEVSDLEDIINDSNIENGTVALKIKGEVVNQ